MPPTCRRQVRENEKTDYDTTLQGSAADQPPTKVRETDKTDYDTTFQGTAADQPTTKVRETEKINNELTHIDYSESANALKKWEPE